MGVVTRGMGTTGCFGGACEGARADPACGAAARASGEELGKATVGYEIGVPSVARAQRAGAGAVRARGFAEQTRQTKSAAKQDRAAWLEADLADGG